MTSSGRFGWDCRFILLAGLCNLSRVLCTWRHYNQLNYGTGDSVMTTFHNHGGSNAPYRKWLMECFDGEAMTGVNDWQNDFERIEGFACKFLFPNKPPAFRYPYYANCFVKNYNNQMFCFDAQNASDTIHSVITAFWDDDQQFVQIRPAIADVLQYYKCCRVPAGYYIDYVSCYYIPTHDIYWEYYDAQQQILTQCGTGYAMTGISKKQNPWTGYFNLDWIQCCRIGFGAPAAVSPPVTYSQSGTPTFYARDHVDPSIYSRTYRDQTVSLTGVGRSDCEPAASNPDKTKADNNFCSSRYERPIPVQAARVPDHPDGEADHGQFWSDPNKKDPFFGLEPPKPSEDII
ncbi:hypothetical protein BV898_10832 [Hypsibius exemplaris]|uniref:Apextrin C-terminal domain-containing protein n=1 Tax=Hypsibius exemplaris TaxID=2072580 RepID=A0A1W0WI95_HYPEX|nr:hypothetical protein BV898_10832 [Hypsibius exemplaris]